MADASALNPFQTFNVGLGDIGNMLLLLFVIVLILAGVGWLVYYKIESRKYIYKIPLYRYYEGVAYKIREIPYLAKNVLISKAGDSLWYVKGVKRWIEPAVHSDGLNSFPHFLTKDGEWINFSIQSVDEAREQAGIGFTHQDVRSNRVSIGELLELRLINKGFWEKYKDILVNIVFYFITAVAMVIIFWQWGGLVESMGSIVDKLDSIVEGLNNLECIGTKQEGLVPA